MWIRNNNDDDDDNYPMYQSVGVEQELFVWGIGGGGAGRGGWVQLHCLHFCYLAWRW